MGNLASVRTIQGRLREAEELVVQVNEVCLRVLGPRYPDTLTSSATLASIYHDQGRLKEAEELEINVMEMSIGVLGMEHPDTITSIENFALTLQKGERMKLMSYLRH